MAAPGPLPDPGGVQAAVERYRDLAKYLIAIFAGVGAILVAGTQLSAIGELSWSANRDRVIAVAAGFPLAIGAIVWIIWRAVEVLKPIEISLEDVVADVDLSADIDSRPAMLGGPGSIRELASLVENPALEDEERQLWEVTEQAIVGRAAYRLASRRFERAWRGMLGGTIAGVVGIVAFTWGASAPAADPCDEMPRAVPVLVDQ